MHSSTTSADEPVRGRGRPRRDSTQVPDALKHFDQLPDSAFVSEPVVSGLFSVSRPTIYNRMRAGLLPKSYKIGYSTVWNVGELRALLAAMTGKGGEHAAS